MPVPVVPMGKSRARKCGVDYPKLEPCTPPHMACSREHPESANREPALSLTHTSKCRNALYPQTLTINGIGLYGLL